MNLQHLRSTTFEDDSLFGDVFIYFIVFEA